MLRTLAIAAAAAVAAAQTKNIVQLAESAPELSTLVAALEAGGLVSALEGAGPFTVFAPVNSAFAALGANIPAWLLNPHNKANLDNVLLYHVVSGDITSNKISNGQVIPTLDSKLTVTASVSSAGVKINNAKVIKADLLASNGVVHEIDSVLVPSNIGYPSKDIVATAASVADLSTLVTAVKAGNLTALLSLPNGPYTVLAPTNEAFAALPQNVLNYLLTHPKELDAVLAYHVIGGGYIYSEQIHNLQAVPTLNGEPVVFFTDGPKGGVVVNGIANVTIANVDTANGVVHVIDRVLLPKAVSAKLEAHFRASASATAATALPNIVQLAENDPQLSILVKAVVAAGLVNTLEGAGPFTVFAPVDKAFLALPQGVLEWLLAHPTTDLKTVLLYHTVAGAITSRQLYNKEQIATVEGANATVTITSRGEVFINAAQVIQADLAASNGFVHVIDRVLLPPSAEAAEAAEQAAREVPSVTATLNHRAIKAIKAAMKKASLRSGH